MSDQLTLLEYAERAHASAPSVLIKDVTVQDLVDHMVSTLLHIDGAPRVYEVERGADGRLSLIWVARPLADWEAIINQLTAQVLVRALRQAFGDDR